MSIAKINWYDLYQPQQIQESLKSGSTHDQPVLLHLATLVVAFFCPKKSPLKRAIS